MSPTTWQVRDRVIALDRPIVMGVVNITPDSFSDGGAYLQPDAAARHAEQLMADGADILDLGAESTRPGRPEPVSVDEELRRLLPVLDIVRREFPDTSISVDTVHSDTARQAIDRGVHIINDVTGLRNDPSLAAVCRDGGVGVILMHSRGALPDIATYDHADYGPNLVRDVVAELELAMGRAELAGVSRECLVVDPGLGFGKRPPQNWELLRGLEVLGEMGRPVLIGPSRKRFIGEVTERSADERDTATAAVCAMGGAQGARLFRVHNVRATRDALAVARAWETV